MCRAVCEVLRPAAGVAYVDAYSDYDDELPVVVADAQRELRELGRRRGTGDPGMAVELDPADEEQWQLLLSYGAWSIQAELWTPGRVGELATLHDCAYSVSAELDADEAEELATRLGGLATLERLQTVRRRERETRRAARRRWWPR